MILRRILVIWVVGSTLFLAPLPGVATAGETGDRAEKFISSLASQAIEALTTSKISKQDREKRFRVLLTENFAIKSIARWVLGRHWKKATQGQRTEYLKLFEELLIVTYVDRFSSYSGENLKVIKSQENSQKDAMVYSEIVRQGSKAVHVDWRVQTNDNLTFKIVDVMVEGVSMGLTQRSEFASVIRQNGGKVEGLLVQLRKRVG